MAALEIPAELAILFFVVTTMLSVGMALSVPQIVATLHSPRRLLSALAANFIIVPLLAYLLTRTIPLAQPLAIGLLLLGSGAGAPFSPKLVQFARGDLAFSVGLTILLMLVTVGFMPIVLLLLLPMSHVRPWLIAKPLVTVMLAPLLLGLLIRARGPTIARYSEPVLRRASTVGLVLAVVLVITANYRNAVQMVDFRAILAAVLLLVLSLACGFVLGGPSSRTRSTLAFATGQRDLSAALLVGVETFSDKAVIVMIIVTAVLGLCIQLPIALILGKHADPT